MHGHSGYYIEPRRAIASVYRGVADA
jgi:hypothetical protein